MNATERPGKGKPVKIKILSDRPFRKRRARPLTRVFALLLVLLLSAPPRPAVAEAKIEVIATIPDYAWLAGEIGGPLVSARALCEGDQDVHFVRPRPSFASALKTADLFITTGLDLELWVPGLLEKAANRKVMSGQPGYVAAADGLDLIEKPTVMSRSEGGLHVYGNPHVTVSPANLVGIANNIRIGLAKIAPDHAATFERNYLALRRRMAEKIAGAEVTAVLGDDLVVEMSGKGTLVDFLGRKSAGGKPLLDKLGGWLGRTLPLRGLKIVTYHRTWSYFTRFLGLEVAGELEPKPGIPPSPRHVADLIARMRGGNIKVIWGENYYDQGLMRNVAAKTGGTAVIVPVFTNGESGTGDYFKLMDLWVERLVAAAGGVKP